MPDADAVENLSQDVADVLAEVRSGLSNYPAGWAERRRQTGGQLLEAFNAWKKMLSAADAWGHCGDVTKHDEHRHTVVMNEGPAPGTCVGTPDLVLLSSTEELERSRALRPGAQPLPIPQEGVPGSHDMVLADLRGILARRQAGLRAAGQTREAETVRKLLKEIETDLMERRALGLRRYGSLLQPGNGRDPLRDAYEEVLDLVAYFRQLIMARDEAVTLLVELLNDRGVGEDPIVREIVGRVMYLLAGDVKKGLSDG